MSTITESAVHPPSGQIIGIGGTEDTAHVLRVAGDGTLPNTEEELDSRLLDVSNCQGVNIWLILTKGSLTSYSILPVYLHADGSTEFRAFGWLYDASTDNWVADSPLEYKVLVSASYMISIPTWGANFMKFRHSSIGTVTSSSAIIKVSRNFNMLRSYIANPA